MKVRKDFKFILTVLFMAVAALVLVPVRANAADSGTFSVYGEYTCSYSREASSYGSILTISSTSEKAEADKLLIRAMEKAGIYGGSEMIIFDFPNSTRGIGAIYTESGLGDFTRITIKQKSAEIIYVPTSNRYLKTMTVSLTDAETVNIVNDTINNESNDAESYPEINLNVTNMTELNIEELNASKLTVTESGYPNSCIIHASSMLVNDIRTSSARVQYFEYTHNKAVSLSKSGINATVSGNKCTVDQSLLSSKSSWNLTLTPEYKDVGITVYVPYQAAAGNMSYKDVSLTKKANKKYSSINIDAVFANSNLAPNYTAGALYYMSDSLGYGSAVNTGDYVKENPLILAVNNAQNVTVTKNLYGGVTQTEAKPLTSSITALQIPSRTGYTFTGWNHAKSSGTTAVTYNSGTWSGNSYVMKGTNVCTAQWRANAYQVTMNGNGGQIFEGNAYDSGEGADTKTISQTFDAVHGCLSYIPYRKGYTFKGWAANPD